jgi:TonB family protein
VIFAVIWILGRLAPVSKFPMRPYLAVTFLTLSVGVTVFSPSLSLAQDQPDARKIVSKVVPVYPELASKMQIRGTVKLEVIVAPSGKMKATQVIGGSPVFTKAAVDAIDKWRWVPAPQETKELIELNFHP